MPALRIFNLSTIEVLVVLIEKAALIALEGLKFVAVFMLRGACSENRSVELAGSTG